MLMLMSREDFFIHVNGHAGVIVLVRPVAPFVPMEMGVGGAVFVHVVMRMQHLVAGSVAAIALRALRRTQSLVAVAHLVHRLYPLYSRNKNSGAPRNDVMAPIGKMMGEIIMRAMRSDASMMVDPSASDAGSKNR